MTAEGNLYNPSLFSGINPNSGAVAMEFAEIASRHKYPTLSSFRGHMFKIFHHVFLQDGYKDQRDMLASAASFEDISNLAKEVHGRLSKYSGTVIFIILVQI